MYKIPSFKSTYHQNDIDTVLNVIERGMRWADGPEIDLVEKELENYLNVKHALTFNSGTSALYTLLLALDVKGFEVICPTFTFIATVNAIELAGGIPVFADSEHYTFGLDAQSVEQKITEKTKAIITIDYGGCIGIDTKKISAIAKKHNLFFIEDAAQSFGATMDSKHVGAFSDAAIFSFCQNKVITALGEGGALITKHSEIYQKAKYLRSHGRVDMPNKKHFEISSDNEYLYPGFNFRMPTISAAFLISQLRNINNNLSRRRYIAQQYEKEFSKHQNITLPCPPEGHTHCYQMYTIRLPNHQIRDNLKQYLLDNKILVRCYFELIHLKPYYLKKCGNLDLPGATALSNTVLTLPMFPSMTDEEIAYVIKYALLFMQKHG